MSEFKNLSDEDVLRIERGIVYSFPARRDDGRIFCVGEYGDLSNKCPVDPSASSPHSVQMSLACGIASARISFWICHRIDTILSGEKVLDSKDWKIVDGKPVAPPYITVVPGTASYIDTRSEGYPSGRIAGQHDSDCSTNNRGVPELLGPCDCSLSIEQGFQKFLLGNGYANLSVEEAEELRAAYQHGASGHALAPCVPLPAPDASGNIYGLPQALFTEPKGLRSAFQDHAKYLAAQAQAKGEKHLLEGRIFEKAQQLGLV